MDDFKDERFTGIIKDPRFKKIPSKHTKPKLDKRIHGMFSNKQLKLGGKVDKRGLPLDYKITKDNLEFYQQDESEKDENKSSSEDEENATRDLDEESGRDDLSMKKFHQVDGSDEEDGSTSTDTDISDNEQEDDIDHHWQELDADAPRASNITRRLAVCNMDWDRLCAEDFLVVFNSFKPPDGVIRSIKIYPSEFGLERLEKEKLHGPAELINSKKLNSTEDKMTNGEQDSHFHREKLRQYQINRLKYFFAVVDCDSPQTADALYDELNGMEFESSGCILDLRFIPDDMTFDQEPVSVASSVSCIEDYKPTQFVTSALNQIKVDLTWDETDPRRKEILEKAFTDPESIEKDLKEYLASPSESEDEMEEVDDSTDLTKLSSKAAIAKYRALLQTLEEKEKGQGSEEFDMEITWDSGLKEKTEKLVKEKALKENLTPFEESLQKRKELKKTKKEKRMALKKGDDGISSSEEYSSGDMMDDELKDKVKSAAKGHKKNEFKSVANSEADEKKLAELALLVAELDEKDSSDSDSMTSERKNRKKKKKKGNEKKVDSVAGYVDDPRFAAMYTSHLYHVDPAEQKFKEKKETQVFIEATQRKKYGGSGSAVTSCDVSEKETSFTEGLKGKGKKSGTVEALKEKLTPLCREFQKKKASRKSGKQVDQSPQKEGQFTAVTENSPGSVSEVNSSKKRGKKKRIFHEVSDGDELSASGPVLNNSTFSYMEDNDDSDILIFSGDSAKPKVSNFSSESLHSTNSVRKKFKKNHVS